MGILRQILCIVIVAITPWYAVFAANSETVQPNDGGKPAFIEADAMFYDEKAGIVRAEGHVEIIQDGRVLLADKVVYNQQTNKVDAYGDISLLEQSGAIYFAEEAELRDGLKEGVIEHFSARMQDGSLFVADQAERKPGNITTLERAVFSPCPVCKEEPDSDPMWQMKSRKVTIDEEEQRVVHNHAFFEVYGVPVMYTPYLSHATPGADRKSGFLMPSYGSRSELGEFVKVPYYYNIAPERDATFNVQYFSGVDPVLSSEYRALTDTGYYEMSGSITRSDKFNDAGDVIPGSKIRGHIQGEGEFDLERGWKWGFDAKRSTDDTYLRRYGFYNEDSLTSHVYSRKIEGNNMAVIEALSFQGLNEDDDPGQTPLVLPFARAYVESEPGLWGAYTTLDSSMLALFRGEGTSSNRLSTKAEWVLPNVTRSGHVMEYKLSLRGDGYVVQDVDRSDSGENEFNGFTGRLVPQAEIKWRYPLMKPTEYGRMFVEPVVNFVVSPHGNNPNELPNEDSQDVEFSDENLFSSNHFIGYDRIEGGPRTNYGLRAGVHSIDYGELHTMFGQSYRTKVDNNFSEKSGLNNHFSDYVGRLGYRFEEHFTGAYHFRIDKDDANFSKNEVNLAMNVSPVRLGVNYLSVDDSNEFSAGDDVNASREIMTTYTGLQLSKFWSVSFDTHRDLAAGQWIRNSSRLVYDGDCLMSVLSWQKDFTRNRDVPQSDSFLLQIVLKNF